MTHSSILFGQMILASAYFHLFGLLLFTSVGVSEYDPRDRRPPVRGPPPINGQKNQIPIMRSTSPPPRVLTSTSRNKFTPSTTKGVSST